MKLSPELKKQLSQIKHFALDMDGTIYNGSTLFDYTNDFLNYLKKSGIGYSFLTNNPSKSTDDYLKHLSKMGIQAERAEMNTSAQATIQYLKHHHPNFKKLFLLGTPSMIKEFEDAGYTSTADSPDDKPDALIVAFDRSLSYPRLCRAAYWASQGLPYIATNPDWVCPTDEAVVLVDCGAICACIEAATKRKPDLVIGKPDPRMLEGIIHEKNLLPQQIAMVGDRIYTDVMTAINAGGMGILVLSGEANMQDVAEAEVAPHLVVDDLAQLKELIIWSRT